MSGEHLYEVTVTFTARTRSYSLAGAVADGAQMVSDWLDRTEVLSIESKAVPLPVEPDDLIAELPTDAEVCHCGTPVEDHTQTDNHAPVPVTTPIEDEYDPFGDEL